MKRSRWQLLAKSALDKLLAAGALAALSPLLALVAGAVWMRSGSPVLFVQQRPGLGGRPFPLYKFRTMLPARDPLDRSLPDEVRLTRLGRFLRSTSLDELPQLLNVLRGEMSLVGPRPLLMEYQQRYTARQTRRQEVKPGITGWAQINGRNAISWEEKFELDVWYVDNASLAVDLKILVLTLGKVFQRSGIQAADHATMPEFLGSPQRKQAA